MLIYLKKKTKPVQDHPQPQFVPLLKINGNIPVQTLPSPITFAEDPAQPLPPYVPGSNKQQYLRGVSQTKPALRPQTRPAFPQFAPLVQVRGGNTAAQTLPSPNTLAFGCSASPHPGSGSLCARLQ